MSALNELVYSQQYQHSDANSFVFVLKVRLSELPTRPCSCTMIAGVHIRRFVCERDSIVANDTPQDDYM